MPLWFHELIVLIELQVSIIKTVIAQCINTDMCHYKLFQYNMILCITLKWLRLKKRPTSPWRRHQMETFSALLALCAGNSPVTGEFPSQRPVTWSFDAFFDLCLNKRLSKQWWGWWLETPSCSLWLHCNGHPNRQALRCLLWGFGKKLTMILWHLTVFHFMKQI